MPERISVPEDIFSSSSVGSSQISSPTTAYMQREQEDREEIYVKARTAEHDATSPSISIPACAKAALAATDPEAMHPSMPSFSMIVMNISMVDFGRSSSRTAEANAC